MSYNKLSDYEIQRYVIDLRTVCTSGNYPALIGVYNTDKNQHEWHPRCQRCGCNPYPCDCDRS